MFHQKLAKTRCHLFVGLLGLLGNARGKRGENADLVKLSSGRAAAILCPHFHLPKKKLPYSIPPSLNP